MTAGDPYLVMVFLFGAITAMAGLGWLRRLIGDL